LACALDHIAKVLRLAATRPLRPTAKPSQNVAFRDTVSQRPDFTVRHSKAAHQLRLQRRRHRHQHRREWKNASLVCNPDYWRDRAKEKRRLAEEMKDQLSKEKILRIARDYERLAQRAEERSKGS
jgi:hypothetical protein